MQKARLTFYRALLPFTRWRPGSSSLTASIFFVVEMDGRYFEDTADIRQPLGPDYMQRPAEVVPSRDVESLVDVDQFKEEALRYFQDIWQAPGAAGINLADPRHNSGNHTLTLTRSAEIDARV